MNLVSKSTFADLADMSVKAIPQYIKRKLIFDTEYNQIDIDDQRNALFIQQRQIEKPVRDAKNALKPPKIKPEKPKKERKKYVLKPKTPKIEPKKPPKTELSEPFQPEIFDGEDEIGNMLNAKHKLDLVKIAKIESDTVLNNIKIDKAAGDLLPTAMVIQVVAAYQHEVKAAFNAGLDIILDEFAKEMEAGNEIIVRYKKRGIEVINNGAETATENTIKRIELFANEYSILRGRGERKDGLSE